MPFKPGQSGNPSGRVDYNKPIALLCRSFTPTVLRRLKRIINDDNAPAAAHIAAGQLIMDRAYGKPPSFSSSDAGEFRKAVDLTDDELATIAASHLKLVASK